MTSILTNIAAQSALATLRTINSQMQNTQEAVSSGLRVGEAKDNAAYWSIATTMRSDNGAISAVEDALGLGAAKIDTAYSGMEAAIDVVKEIKKKLVTATENSVDRSKIQDEISQLQDQLKSIADSASFSGENLLKATFVGSLGATHGSILSFAVKDVKTIVTGFVRDSNNNVSVKTTEAVQTSDTVLFGNHTEGMAHGILDVGLIYDGIPYEEGNGGWFIKTFQYDSSWTVNENGVYSDGTNYYTRRDGLFVKALDASGGFDKSSTTNVIMVSDASVTTMDITKLDTYRDQIFGPDGDEDMVLDVLISHTDKQLAKMTDAASSLGSLSKRIELQSDFAAKLSDAIDSGIGRLVDADMNEESTRLKALQTQQQLGIQALSIANTQPDNVTQLFR